jgi:tetratricopeptide (TPR) repeat protein
MTFRWAWWITAVLWCSPGYLGARPEIHVLIAAEGAWPDGLEGVIREVSNRLTLSDLVLWPVPEKPAALPEADEWLAEAEAALERLDLDAASAAHARALEAFAQSATLKRPMPELFLSRALLFYVQGNTPTAKKELSAAAVLAPTFTPDPIRYPPKLLKLYQEALQSTQQKPTAALEIIAPEGASIWVDGVLSRAPWRLPVGVHYVRVESPGCLPFVQQLALSEAGASLTAALPEDEFAQDQARRALAAQDPGALRGWASAHELKQLLVLTPSAGQWELVWLRSDDPAPLGQTKVSPVNLAEALLQMLEPAAPFSLPVAEAPPTPQPEESARWRSPAFWVPVGLGLVGGAVLLSLDLLNEQNGARPGIDLRRRP